MSVKIEIDHSSFLDSDIEYIHNDAILSRVEIGIKEGTAALLLTKEDIKTLARIFEKEAESE